MNKTLKNTLLIIIVLLMITFIFLLYAYLNKNNSTTNDKKETTTSYLTLAENTTTNELITMIKDYYYENNLIDEKNISTWNINTIKYLGFYNNQDTLYYLAKGIYKCLDNTGSCIYLEQEPIPSNNTYEFKIYLEIEYKDNKPNIKNITQSIDENKLNKEELEIKDDTEFEEKITQKIKDYYQSKSLITENNLEYWNITSIEYFKNKEDINIYEIKSTYKCQNGSSCIYTEQESEPNSDDSYNLNFFIEFNSNEEITNIYNVYTEKESDSKESITKEELTTKTKNYFQENNFIVSTPKIWNINKITYSGYYKNTPNQKIYHLEGSYQCQQNNSDCIYLEQVYEMNKDKTYPFSIYVTLDSQNNIESIFSTLTTTNFVTINKEIK